MKKCINNPAAGAAVGAYSQAIEANGLVFVSGQLPIDASTGVMPESVEEQTRQSLTNVQLVLSAAGLAMSDIVKTTVYLADIADFAAMNGVYATFFEAPFPARAAFAVKALPKGAKVEIECVAAR